MRATVTVECDGRNARPRGRFGKTGV